MSLASVFNIAGTGMSAQSTRLNTVASNIANAESVSSSIEQTYRARHPVFATVFQQAGGQPNESLFAGQDEADIEDFFALELFAELVNKTYKLAGEHALTAEKLAAADTTTQRLVKKAEAYFKLLPAEIPEFSHFDPAMHLLQHPELLKAKGKAVETTLKRFEAAFERIEEFL